MRKLKAMDGNRFFVKIIGCSNTHNDNGYKTWELYWAFFKLRRKVLLYTQILGNGDCGDRCNNGGG